MDGIGPIASFGLQISDLSPGTNPPSAICHPPSDPVDRTDAKKQQIAKDFESVLLAKLFDQVQESIGNWELDEDGTSQQVQGLFWLYLARDAADKGGFGLWRDIYEHLQHLDGIPGPAALIEEEL